jgi:sugar phosphate isomerase/epimerase
MRFGASIWPLRWDTPYETYIPRIAQMGFKAVELIAWNKQALDEYYTRQRIKVLRDIIASEGLILSEFVSTPRSMAHPDATERERAYEHFKQALDVALELGTRIINTVSVYPFAIEMPRITHRPLMQEFRVDIPPDLDWRRNWHDYVDLMRRCCELCEQLSARYALEPHPYRYMANAAGMLRLIDHVQSPALGMNFDPSHLFPVGEIPHVVIYQLGDRIFHCHFSDNDALTNAHWRPGKGKIDWTAVMQALKDVDYTGVISIELEDVPGVSRGANNTVPGLYRHAEATDEFVRETVEAMRYIRAICDRLDIPVE